LTAPSSAIARPSKHKIATVRQKAPNRPSRIGHRELVMGKILFVMVATRRQRDGWLFSVMIMDDILLKRITVSINM
jgi:hypothetical protein